MDAQRIIRYLTNVFLGSGLLAYEAQVQSPNKVMMSRQAKYVQMGFIFGEGHGELHADRQRTKVVQKRNTVLCPTLCHQDVRRGGRGQGQKTIHPGVEPGTS